MRNVAQFVICGRRGFLKLCGAVLAVAAAPTLAGCAVRTTAPEPPFFDDGTGFES